MKRYFHSLAATMIFMLPFVSCDNDDRPSSSDIVGSWYGTRSYYNPVGGTKYQYLTVEFQANGIGSLEYEAPTTVHDIFMSCSFDHHYRAILYVARWLR